MADSYHPAWDVSLPQREQRGEEPQTSQPLGVESQYPHSVHDNRDALNTSIYMFDGGLGRRKCPERRQHNSHFWLCHMGVPGAVGRDSTAYQTDFLPPEQEVEATQSRRFPRSHQKRSNMAAAALKQQEPFFWFGRHNATDTHTRAPARSHCHQQSSHNIIALLQSEQD